ncbi:MAG TPA: helix-hairpin-helix domain-containing protein [Thiotrichaceae bacterium]|nr:helix-hairpin-helix domain-containing protein [Thiotrichaceae bacterium]
MNKLTQALVLMLSLAVVTLPAMAKKEDDSSSEVKSSVRTKSKIEKTKTEKSSTKKSKSDKKDSSSTSKSTSKSSTTKKPRAKKSVKSGMMGTNKAKEFKNITVNINKADSATLSHYLVGIGERRAKDIVSFRKKNGKFKSIEDLLKVPGIGDAIFAGLKKNVSLIKGETSAPAKPAKSKTSSTSSKSSTRKKSSTKSSTDEDSTVSKNKSTSKSVSKEDKSSSDKPKSSGS